jgi:flagellar motor protein MotB
MKFDFPCSEAGSNLNNQPSWMVTYSDTLSLLVTFFVMLVAFANTSEMRVRQAMSSARAQLGGTTIQSRTISTNFKSSIPALDPLIERFLVNYAAVSSKSQESIPFYFVKRNEGVALVLNAKDFFKSGSAVSGDVESPEVYAALQALAGVSSNEIKIVSILPEKVSVISQNTKTAWGLAAERGLFIFSKLVENNKTDANRVLIGVVINSEEKNKEILSHGFPDEQIQIVFCGLSDVEKILPAEIIQCE